MTDGQRCLLARLDGTSLAGQLQVMQLSFTMQHSLSLDELRARIEARVRVYNARYPRFEIARHYRWTDERHAVAEYRGGRGAVAIGDDAIHAEMELPFFARLYRARIEAFVQRELATLLASEREESLRA